MYIYLIVVWNTIIHFERDFSTTKNQRIVTRDQPFPSAAVSVFCNNPRHPATDKHSNTSHNTEDRSHDDVLLSYGWWRKTKWVIHYLIKLSKYNIAHEQDVGQLDTVSRGNPINQVNETV